MSYLLYINFPMSYTLSLLRLVPSQGVSPSSPRPFSTPFSLSSSPGWLFLGPVVVLAPLFIILLSGFLWAPIAGSLSLSFFSGV